MGSFWKIQSLSFDLPSGENYGDDNIDISPPETENWTPTERRRKRNPLLFLPEDDNSIKFFEKGLHQTVDRPESERDLTPYGGLKFSWKVQPEIRKIVDDNGSIYYFNDTGQSHREDGPAIEYTNGDKLWFINDKHHRLDGPAVMRVDYNAWYINDYFIGDSDDGFDQEDFENYKREHSITSSQKLSWGSDRNIWVTHWAIPGNQKMNPTDSQQDWTVAIFCPSNGHKESSKVIKERFKDYVGRKYLDESTKDGDYIHVRAKLWNIKGEKSDFLDKYLTVEEINNVKEDSIVVIQKSNFPVGILNVIESF